MQRRSLFAIACILACSLWPFYRRKRDVAQHISLPFLLSPRRHSKLRSLAINATLGFEKIYVINMPNRDDRRDDLTLLGAMHGLNFTLEPGVAFSSADHEGLPYIASHVRDNEVGCWRAHVNVWRKMVDDDVQTALILEDDVDFDVNVKEAMQYAQAPLATLLAALNNRTTTPSPPSRPWIDADWDMLYFGACLETVWGSDGVMSDRWDGLSNKLPPMVAYQDPTVGSIEVNREETTAYLHRMGIRMPDAESDRMEDRQRIVIQANVPWCMTSYALTRKGALRLLYYATRKVLGPVDEQTILAAQDGLLRTYVYFPPLFDQFKVHSSFKNSDINERPFGGQEVFQPAVGHAFHIRNSARKAQRSKISLSSF